MIIVLIGFMGTGKSTVGKELAKRIAYPFYDTDIEIEKRVDLTIPEIFKNHGEVFFRQLEEEVLQELVKNNKDLVIATGGGIILSEINRKLLREKTRTILLQASVEEIYNRLKGKTDRPLLAVEDSLTEIKRLLLKREKYYRDADIKLSTDGFKPDELVEIIIENLKLNL